MWFSLCLYQKQVQYETPVLYLHTCSEPVWLVSYYILNEALAWQHHPDRSCRHLCAWQSTFKKIAVILDALSAPALFTARGIFRRHCFQMSCCRFEMWDLPFLHTNFLSHCNCLLVMFIFLLRVLHTYRRPVNPKFTEKHSAVLVNFIPVQRRNKFLNFIDT